jgi:hypothetical protein
VPRQVSQGRQTRQEATDDLAWAVVEALGQGEEGEFGHLLSRMSALTTIVSRLQDAIDYYTEDIRILEAEIAKERSTFSKSVGTLSPLVRSLH